MDFSALNTKIPAEKGAWLHLRHPATGAFLYDGHGESALPCRVFVRGLESKTVQARAKNIRKNTVEGQENEDGLEFVSALIIDFENVERSAGVPLTGSDADVRWFLVQSDSFVEQVMDFAKKRSNFFEKASNA